jgi:hypothetical protein
MSEIVSIQQADQFVAGHSAYECGFYAVSMCSSIAPLGKPPRLAPSQISNQAQQWYKDYNGDNSSANTDGMSLDQLYRLVKQAGLFYRPLPMTDGAIEASINAGYPVIVAVAETSVFDMSLGRNPYPWTPSGNHVIVVTGIRDPNSWEIRDSANIAAPNTLRPGPRQYDRHKLQYVSATAIGVTPVMAVPQGWHDDGHTLTAPNNIPVVLGFRDWVLNNHWSPGNWPLKPEMHFDQLELSNLDLGGGQRQPFRECILEYPSKTKQIVQMWVGQELLFVYQALADMKAQLANAAPADNNKIKDFINAQIAAAQAFEGSLS